MEKVKGLVLHFLVGLLFWPFAAPVMGVILGFLYTFYPSALINGFLKYGGYITLPGFSNGNVKVDNVEISYMERPASSEDEPTVVFVHGFTSQKLCWMPVIKFLPSSWRIVAIDLPGHGQSGLSESWNCSADGVVSLLHKVVTSIGLEKFHIIGESMGSVFAGQFTAAHRDMVQSITMLCPPITHRLEGGESTPVMDILDGKEVAEKNPLLPTSAEEFRKMLDLVLHDNSGSGLLHDRLIDAVVDAHRRHYPHFKTMLQHVREGGETREMITSRIEKNEDIPSMVLWGQQDQVCHVSGAKLIKKLNPKSKVVIINNCGHCMSVERPRKCGQFIEKFIRVLA